MAKRSRWVGILIVFTAIAALVGLIMIFIDHGKLWDIRANTPVFTGSEVDNPWYPCKQRIHKQLDDLEWVETSDKVDGTACNNVCLNATASAPVCEHGECVGECAGHSEYFFAIGPDDCPEIKLANVVNIAGIFRTSISLFGKCIYLMFNVENIPPYGLAGFSQVALNSREMERRMSENLYDLIGDSEPTKIGSCLDASFLPTQFSPIASSVGIITFNCATYSIYAGNDSANLTLSLGGVSGASLSGMPADYVEGTDILTYIWNKRDAIEQAQIGTKGDFPKISMP